MVPCLQVSPPKPSMHFFSPHTCYMPRPSLDFITQNFARSTNHEAPHYVITSIPLFLPPLRPEHLPQKPYSRTPSAPQCERPSLTPISK